MVKGKARKPQTFLHNLLKFRGAHKGAKRELQAGTETTARTKQKLHEMCFYFGRAVLSLLLLVARHYPLACVHLFFICMNFSLFSQTPKRTERTALYAPQDQHKHAIFVSGKSA